MVCGACPFRNADPKEDMHYYRVATRAEETWRRYPHICQPLRDLIHGMLAYQPVERYTMTEIHANEWFQGEVFSPHELVVEMRVLHQESLAAKGTDGTGGDEEDSYLMTTRSAEGTVDFPPVLVEFEKLKYLTNFHTYEVDKDQLKMCIAKLNKSMLTSVRSQARDFHTNDDLWVYTARYEKRTRNTDRNRKPSEKNS